MTSNTDVVVSPRTDRNVRDILQYTAKTWGTGQRDIYRKVLRDAFERIGAFPEIGHPVEGKSSSFREYHIRHHVIQYRLEPDRIVILRIVNPRRQRR